MSKEQKIAYEPHPVSVERKAELRAQGFKIIDAVFAPKDAMTEAAEKAEAVSEEYTPAFVLALAGGNFQTFKAAAKKVLGDDMPNTKAEIIAALETMQETAE